MDSMENKVIAISGAASGIGRAMAIKLAHRGTRLCLSNVNETGQVETQKRCIDAGADTFVQLVNVAPRQQVETWAEKTGQTFGGIHMVINNPGVSLSGAVENLSEQDLH